MECIIVLVDVDNTISTNFFFNFFRNDASTFHTIQLVQRNTIGIYYIVTESFLSMILYRKRLLRLKAIVLWITVNYDFYGTHVDGRLRYMELCVKGNIPFLALLLFLFTFPTSSILHLSYTRFRGVSRLKRESISVYSFALSNSSNGFASTTYLMAIARICETRFEYIFVFPRDAK